MSVFALMLKSTVPEKFGVKEICSLQKINADPIVATDSVNPSVNFPNRQSAIQQLQVSSLLTGDGLVTSGLSKTQTACELQKIHAENLHLLAGLSQEEIREEQIRINELLGK